MNESQKAKLAAINAEVEITMDAIADGEVSIEMLNTAKEDRAVDEYQRIAYAICLHLLGA